MKKSRKRKILIIRKKTYRGGKSYKNKKKLGGDAVAAGGYGCVFKPALECAANETYTSKRITKNNKRVSKLLLKENAFDEMQEIEKVLKYIKKYPENSNYFIINDQTSTCTPAPLKASDLTNYEKMCNMTKIANTAGITSKNINQNLEQLHIINMVDGGKDLEKVFVELILKRKESMKDTLMFIKKINMQLIKLLNNAILKLNKDGLYHFDIKGANILLGQDGHTRLTDWGSSFEYQSSKDSIHIPFKLYDRAIFQYNVPFSVILFSDELLNLLKEKKPRSTSSSSKTIAQNDVVAKMLSQESILFSIKENGIGHFENILEFMIMVYRDIFDNKKFTRDNAIQMIQDYLADIFLNYFDFTTYTFNLPAFFNEVFLHNVDLYGFILTYIELVMPNNINIISIIKSNKNYFALVNELSLIFNEFCWSPRYASKPIPHKTLTTRLNRLNIIASE